MVLLGAAAVAASALAIGVAAGRVGPVRENSPQVVAARDVAWQEQENILGAVFAGPLSAHSGELARTKDSACYPGEHNWKYSDPFDLSCRARTAVLVPGGTLETFRDDMIAVEDRFTAAGWEFASNTNMRGVLFGYWDDRANILGPEPRYFDYPSDLPDVAYDTRGVVDPVRIAWVQRKPVPPRENPTEPETVWVTNDGRELVDEQVWDLAPEGGYLLEVSMQTTYYEK